MAVIPLYKIKGGARRVVAKDGTTILFISGKCWGKDDKERRILAEMAAEGEAGIYVDTEDSTVDTEALDPISVIKRKAVQEYLAEQGRLIAPSTSSHGQLNVAGSDQGATLANHAIAIPIGVRQFLEEDKNKEAAEVAQTPQTATGESLKAALAAKAAQK